MMPKFHSIPHNNSHKRFSIYIQLWFVYKKILDCLGLGTREWVPIRNKFHLTKFRFWTETITIINTKIHTTSNSFKTQQQQNLRFSVHSIWFHLIRFAFSNKKRKFYILWFGYDMILFDFASRTMRIVICSFAIPKFHGNISTFFTNCIW